MSETQLHMNRYEEHFSRAIAAEEANRHETAQVHALLAQAAATAALVREHERMVDSYNGWKDIGK